MSLLARLREDVAAVRRADPAARSLPEVVLGYSGMHAIWAHRVAHRWWRSPRLRLPARLLSQIARSATGVEIHPGARIGRRFVIDHGMGVVIGETAVVGEDVLIYHGVTLGGKARGRGKRHPTLEDGVTVGAGAKVLGDITIGAGSVIGANAVVVRDAPSCSVLAGVPAHSRPLKGVRPVDERREADARGPGSGSSTIPALDPSAGPDPTGADLSFPTDTWLDPAVYI